MESCQMGDDFPLSKALLIVFSALSYKFQDKEIKGEEVSASS